MEDKFLIQNHYNKYGDIYMKIIELFGLILIYYP